MEHGAPDAVRIILGSLLRISENFMGRLYGLEFGVEFQFLAWIAIRMVLESFGEARVSLLALSL